MINSPSTPLHLQRPSTTTSALSTVILSSIVVFDPSPIVFSSASRGRTICPTTLRNESNLARSVVRLIQLLHDPLARRQDTLKISNLNQAQDCQKTVCQGLVHLLLPPRYTVAAWSQISRTLRLQLLLSLPHCTPTVQLKR